MTSSSKKAFVKNKVKIDFQTIRDLLILIYILVVEKMVQSKKAAH
jgi:hypothetical protein